MEADPIALKYIAGAGVLALSAVLCWFEKIPDSIMATLLLGAAAALGFQITPGG